MSRSRVKILAHVAIYLKWCGAVALRLNLLRDLRLTAPHQRHTGATAAIWCGARSGAHAARSTEGSRTALALDPRRPEGHPEAAERGAYPCLGNPSLSVDYQLG
jgi:hypothetical protein